MSFETRNGAHTFMGQALEAHQDPLDHMPLAMTSFEVDDSEMPALMQYKVLGLTRIMHSHMFVIFESKRVKAFRLQRPC